MNEVCLCNVNQLNELHTVILLSQTGLGIPIMKNVRWSIFLFIATWKIACMLMLV